MLKTSAKINKATSAEAAKLTADTRGKMRGVVKKPWDKPVSQSFYQKLVSRVEEIIHALGYARGWRDEFMKLIDLYLKSGECPQRRYCDEFVFAMFYSLKGEVDAAVRRSANARRRAIERRAGREAGLSKSEGIGGVYRLQSPESVRKIKGDDAGRRGHASAYFRDAGGSCCVSMGRTESNPPGIHPAGGGGCRAE